MKNGQKKRLRKMVRRREREQGRIAGVVCPRLSASVSISVPMIVPDACVCPYICACICACVLAGVCPCVGVQVCTFKLCLCRYMCIIVRGMWMSLYEGGEAPEIHVRTRDGNHTIISSGQREHRGGVSCVRDAHLQCRSEICCRRGVGERLAEVIAERKDHGT